MSRIILFGIILLITSLIGQIHAQPTNIPRMGFYIDSSPQGATVYIEGELVGKTPCWFPHDIAGRYKLVAERSGFENWVGWITFGAARIDSITLKLHPKRLGKAALRSLVLPGWGQRYSERPASGWVFSGLYIASLAGLGFTHYQYETKLDDYNHALDRYNMESMYFEREAKAWAEVTAAHSDLDDAFNTRRVLLYTVGAIYLVNMLDTVVNFPKTLRHFDFVTPPITNRSSSVAGGIRLSFNF
jgi:hypothetical protein